MKQKISFGGVINMQALNTAVKKSDNLYWLRLEDRADIIINGHFAVQLQALEAFDLFATLISKFKAVPEVSQGTGTGLQWSKGYTEGRFCTMDYDRIMKVSAEYHVCRTGLFYSGTGPEVELWQEKGKNGLACIDRKYSEIINAAEGHTATAGGRSPLFFTNNEGTEKLVICPMRVDSPIIETLSAAL